MKMPDPHFSLVEMHACARTYFFRSAEVLGGWAYCTVNDATGELLITSDWGNWAHIWNPKHLGCPSLTDFITGRKSYGYLASKLLGHDGEWILDADATIKKWRKRLCQRRLDQGRGWQARGRHYQPSDRAPELDEPLAREIWHSLGSLVDDDRHESIFIEHALHIEGFTHWITNEPWEETEHGYSPAYRLLVDFLLPALDKACSATLRSQVA